MHANRFPETRLRLFDHLTQQPRIWSLFIPDDFGLGSAFSFFLPSMLLLMYAYRSGLESGLLCRVVQLQLTTWRRRR